MAYGIKKRGRRKGSVQEYKVRGIKGLTPKGYHFERSEGEKLVFKRKSI